MRAEEISKEQLTLAGLGPRWAIYAAVASVVGWVATALVAATAEHGIERFFRSYLVNFSFVLRFLHLFQSEF